SVSYAVAAIDLETASSLVEDFCQSRSLPPAARIYISAVGNGNVTVSGPPAQLFGFFSENQNLKSAKIVMTGLFHSAVLYDQSAVVGLLENASPKLLSRVGKLEIVSNSEEGDSTILPGPADQALETILTEVLSRQMRWDLVTQRVADLFKGSQEPSGGAVILPFATGSVQGLASALRPSPDGDAATIVDTARRPQNTGSGRSGADAPGGNRDRTKIAIIGYSGRYPDADSNEEFWDLFMAGLDVVKDIPKSRFDPSVYCDPTGKKRNTSAISKGCFVKNPDLFDARFFGMSPREAEQTDPAQRLALMTAYEAMEMAGLVPDSTPSTQRNRVGVFYGSASDDYREVNAAQNVDTYLIPGGVRAFIPARINYHFRFTGPSLDVDTACSSGLAALHVACNSIWTGDCDVAIAGGTNVMTNPDIWAGLDRAHFLSRTGNCKTFDDGADGYCRAETVASVVLKRLDDAILDGDPIQGVILGALTNHSAESVSITRPHSGAQRAIFSRILDSADVDSSDVSYVEMHGTGTQHGDACEMDSVLSVFAPEGSRREQSLHLGSAKANIGHAESASGTASLIKVLLMMEKNQIPRHVGIKTKINKKFPTDLNQRNVHIAMETTAWPRPDNTAYGRRAFVNNFGAAGGNSSVLLEDAPQRPQLDAAAQDPRPLHVVSVSAKSQAALKRNIRALVDHLDANPDTSLASLSYTTTARRIHHNFRAAVSGKTIRDISQGLQLAETKDHFSQNGGVPVAFCFTGQGAQYIGMGKALLEIPRFRSFVTDLDEVVRLQGFEPILPIIDGSCAAPLETLPPATVQLAMTCLQMALGKLWTSFGIAPKLVVGHSLGEYAAMNVAGVLSDADTIHLVGTRAALLEKHCQVGTHAMLAIKAAASKVTPLMASRPDLEICCANSPEETVVGGPNAEVESFAASLTGLSIKATQLKVQFAFHSAQVEPILEAFSESCASITFKKPTIPLLSPLLGSVITEASDFGTPSVYLSRHCRETVNFQASVLSAKSAGIISDKMVWVEIGPHPTCSRSIKSTLGSTSIRAFPTLRRGEDDWAVTVPTLASLYESGLAINWDDYHAGFKKNLSVLRLPSYKWDLKSHWIQYTGDWLLTKGQCNHDLTPVVQAPAPKKEPFTATVQDLVEESYAAEESWIVARSDAQDPYLAAVLRGHKVNDQPLCSSAVYADMALTMFTRLLEKSPVGFDKAGMGVEVRDLVVDKSLILNNEAVQLVELKAHVQWSTREATFSISSIDSTGKPTANHAKCVGTYSQTKAWKTEWKRMAYLVKARMAHLRQAVDDDDSGVCQIKTGLFYKLFGALVDYDPSFRGCRELIMRSADFESTAKVKFNTSKETAAQFKFPPYWLDSLGHITGFTMNANETLDSKATVYINHGWENMRVAETLSPDITYRTYVKMQDNGGRSYIGDVYVFNPVSDSIIAVYEGVVFSAIPRKVLDKVLPRPAAAASAPTQRAAPVTVKGPFVAPPPATKQAPPAPSARPLPAAAATGLHSAMTDKLRTIVAEEVGAPVSEVVDDIDLADLGVDSLLALTIADRLLEELGVKVDSTLFIAGIKVQELIQIVTGVSGNGNSNSSTASSSASSSALSSPGMRGDDDAALHYQHDGTDTPLSSRPLSPALSTDSGCYFSRDDADVTPTTPLSPPPPAFQCPPATSVLLQGSPTTTAQRTLWLFPDGSGLATAYLQLPDLPPSTTIYGLNSPFVKNTTGLDRCAFEQLVDAYLTELRRRQPCGPYMLGGWSAGGICAYRAAQRLVEEYGEVVEGLVLLDCPEPMGRKKLPERLYADLDKKNVFGSAPGRRPPAWLLEHFMGFSNMLDTFVLRPWAGGSLRTWMVWAADGVDERGEIEIRPEDPRNMTWLMRKRSGEDLKTNGWDFLVGRDKIEVEIVPGANHFSLMQKPAVTKMGAFLNRALMS
ncbi:polyketide synthetase PksP, partial [Chaetomium fimeti]